MRAGPASFSAPTRIVAGVGVLERTGELLSELGDGRVALVCDRGVAEAGVLDRIRAAGLPESLFECAWVGADPSFDAVEALASEAREAGCEIVLGVGGGSGLGAAKGVALALGAEAPLAALEGVDRATARPLPCLAIPTTAGSGSEVSNALVLKRESGPAAQAIVRGRGYEPRIAILDAAVLRDLPERPMLWAGLDALSHALESLWARGRSRFTDALAAAAAESLFDRLPAAIAERRDEDLQAALEASAMANLACGNAGLGLGHALSAASAIRLPHGYQNGVLLPHVAAYNRECLDDDTLRLVDRLPSLYAAVGFAPRFEEDELDRAEAAGMVAAAREHVFRRNNVRDADDDALWTLLEQVLPHHPATSETVDS
ncbi:MAG: iron-containing alcohol dehydrogenase [Solirubrobacterales bacterium]